MLVGPTVRKSKDGSVTITKDASIHIISEFYKQYLGKNVVIEDTPDGETNPMRAAYKWIEKKSQPGETYALAASSKDEGRAESLRIHTVTHSENIVGLASRLKLLQWIQRLLTTKEGLMD